MNVSEYVCNLILQGIVLWTVLKILERSFPAKGKRITSLLLLLILFVFADLLGKYFDNYLLFSIGEQLFFLLGVGIRCKGGFWEKGFAAGMLLAWMVIGANGLNSLFSVLTLWMFQRQTELLLAANTCLTYLGIILLLRIYFGKHRLRPGLFSEKYGRAPCLPVWGLLLLTDVVNFGASRGVSLVSDVGSAADWNPYVNQILAHIEMIVLSVLSLVILLGLTVAMEKNLQYEVARQVHHAKQAYYGSLLRAHEKQLRLRHDMKNHLIGISGLLARKEYEKLEAYVQKLCQKGGVGEGALQSGNIIIDAIVSMKKQEAEEQRIAFEWDVNLKLPAAAEEFEMCILLGNLLDNAIHAECRIADESKRRIFLRAETVKRNFLLEIRNAYYEDGEQEAAGRKYIQRRAGSRGTEAYSKEGRKPRNGECGSSKDHESVGNILFTEEKRTFKEEHYGIGLLNVKQIVEEKGGVLEITFGGGEFCVSVLLPGRI